MPSSTLHVLRCMALRVLLLLLLLLPLLFHVAF
jgi:hypothetical protein